MPHIIAETANGGMYELHLYTPTYDPSLVYHTLFLIEQNGSYRVTSHGSTPNTTTDAQIMYFTDLVTKPTELKFPL